jgi:hypothetical protein
MKYILSCVVLGLSVGFVMQIVGYVLHWPWEYSIILGAVVAAGIVLIEMV